MATLRIAFTKTGTARYMSHLDLNRAFIRALARAGWALAYSEGFNPHPRLAFTMPLPLGVGSLAEFADVRVVDERAPEELAALLAAQLPAGLGLSRVYVPLAPLSAMAMADYEISLPGADAAAVEGLLSGAAVISKRTKSGTRDTDVTALIVSKSVRACGEGAVLEARLMAREGAYLNPEHLASHIRSHLGTPPGGIVKLAALAADGEAFG